MYPKMEKYWHQKHVDKLREKLSNYDNDMQKDNRLNKQECKYCFYIDTDRIAGQAITTHDCLKCRKEMVFPTTSIDYYCLECAKELNQCKHCGGCMD